MECVASFVLLSKLFEVLRYQSSLNVHLWPVITYLVCSYLLDSFYSFLVYCTFCQTQELLDVEITLKSLLVSSAENIRKQFGPKSGPTKCWA